MTTANSHEASVIKPMFTTLEDLRMSNPEYFSHFEDVDLDTAPRAALIDLMDTAPNDQVKFFLFGKFTARLSLAAMGRAAL